MSSFICEFLLSCRYADVLESMHDEEHLSKYEDLLEAAIDLDRIPDEYLIAPTYDSGLEVLCMSHPSTILQIYSLLTVIIELPHWQSLQSLTSHQWSITRLGIYADIHIVLLNCRDMSAYEMYL